MNISIEAALAKIGAQALQIDLLSAQVASLTQALEQARRAAEDTKEDDATDCA